MRRDLFTIGLAVVLCTACEAQGTENDTQDAAAATVDAAYYSYPCVPIANPTGAATFQAVYLEVLCTSGCVNAYCHGSRGAWGDLDMTNFQGAYNALVGRPTGKLVPVDGRPTCSESDLVRVAPGDPERSLMYLKISGRAPCGTRMPPPSSDYPALSEPQIAQVRRWIEGGARLVDTP
jgi:hypothetical protein